MSSEDYKRKLTPQQFKVLREGDTEPPFSGVLLTEKRTGLYACAACGATLFSSKTKYDSGSGWPSFYDVVDTNAVTLEQDDTIGLSRVEVQCSQCGSHLGHVFPDGPKPTGQRYCINSVALEFTERNVAKET